MKIKWLIQDVSMRTSQMFRKYDALSAMGENIACIGVMENHPYVTNLEVVVEEDLDTKYVLLSGVKVLNLIKSAKHISDVMEFPTKFHLENSDRILSALSAGIFYNYTSFDQAHYGELNLPLLNQSADYISIKANLQTSFQVDKFIKPSRDLKAFDAGILKAGQTVEDFIMAKSRQRFYLEEMLVVSDVLEMRDEYRFFVIDGIVTPGSAYRREGIVGEDDAVPKDIIDAANNYALLYQPADIFTMDLAKLYDNSIKIIEYNCFNCSGVYLCDLNETYTEIKKYLSNTSKI
jgi:hypothetical protein